MKRYRYERLAELQQSGGVSQFLFYRRVQRGLKHAFSRPLHSLLIAMLGFVLVVTAGYLLVATHQGQDLLQRVDGRKSATLLFSELNFVLALGVGLSLSMVMEGHSVVGPDGKRSKKFDALAVLSVTSIAMAMIAGIFYHSWLVWLAMGVISGFTVTVAALFVIGLESGLRKAPKVTAGICGVVSIGLLVVLAAFPGWTGNTFGSILVLSTALISWMLVIYTISIIGFLGGSPGRGLKIAVLICLAVWIAKGIVVTGYSLYRGYPSLDYIRTSEAPAPQIQTLDDAFQKWKARFTEAKPKMVVVAAAGGGIRASFWTSLILTRVADRVPNFGNLIFVGSGVSGGSLGLGLSYGLLQSNDLDCFKATQRRETCARNFHRSDFLASTLGATIAGLPLKSLLPFLPYRDAALETAWEDAWHRIAGEGSRSYKFFESPLVASPGGLKELPLLILNATTASSGERSVSANVVIDRWMKPLTTIGCQLAITKEINPPLSAAIGASARFPFVSDPGWIRPSSLQYCDNREAISDGGFFDNYGAVSLREALSALSASLAGKVDLVVIQITSDPSLAMGCLFKNLDEDPGADIQPPSFCKSGARTVASFADLASIGFFNAGEPSAYDIAMESRSISGINAPDQLRTLACDLGGSYYHFGMTAAGDFVPLGWTLSRNSQNSLVSLLDDGDFRKARLDRLVAELNTGAKNGQCNNGRSKRPP